ncbi:MAG: hemolysin III family protein [Alphaproteobacteria bacterium]|nr:hemolysin III family protein [Alphaproteobacteria bacterium]
MHLLGIALGITGAIAIVVVAAVMRRLDELPPILIYAAGLLAMLGCSAAYNMFRTSRWRDWLRRFDHAAIFAMIAGTYTPFTLLGLKGAWSISLTAVIWAVAAIGIAIKLLKPQRIETVSIGLYLALGWIGVVAAGPFMAAFDPVTLSLLAAGGILYSSGVVFHLWHRLPYQNAIWHGFVLAAAAVHYAAVVGVVVEA